MSKPYLTSWLFLESSMRVLLERRNCSRCRPQTDVRLCTTQRRHCTRGKIKINGNPMIVGRKKHLNHANQDTKFH